MSVKASVWITAALLSIAASAIETQSRERCAFFPEHSLRIPATAVQQPGIFLRGLGESEFNDVLAEIQSAYGSVFTGAGKRLVVRADWNDARVNAYATLDDNDNPVLVAPGGMARHPMMTHDGLSTIFCHELGHFLGGAPKAPRGQSGKLSWSSAEGQADYFASAKCLRTLFRDEAKNESFVHALSADQQLALRERCSTYQCMRILAASETVAQIFASVIGTVTAPSLRAADSSVAPSVIFSHPAPQCRLDTLVSGAQCSVSPETAFDNQDPSVGACMPTPRSDEGARPRCWFAGI